ncbi:MAG: acyl-CoA desaturase [Propionibacteriaceae bacterium]|nr:acyl-CoA desaturase [Propionibacteriaceae bacterium]
MEPVDTHRPAGTRATTASMFTPLSQQVREAKLLARNKGFYLGLLGVLTGATIALVVGSFLLGPSWYQLLLAAALGVLLTQFAFVSHEASHHQVFQPGKANDRLGRVLANGVVGVSHSWWVSKHNRHHANPNQLGRDPDIDFDTISFTEADAAGKSGFMGALTRRQGWLFFPLLLLEGLNLHVVSVRTLIASPRSRARTWELVTIAARLGLYLGLIFWLLPVGIAAAFVGVQLAVFGVYMGASFAPNHKGMAIIPADSKLDFLSKQVLTSRNVRGGWFMTQLMGGLNYQVEHHLFPNMPRPQLAKAQVLVRAHCAKHELPYTELGLFRSYGVVIRYLNQVGLSARDPFDCPTHRKLGGW